MLLAALGGLALAAPAASAQVQAFGEVPCEPKPDVRFCSSTVAPPPGADTRVDTFDGVPLDVNVTLPAAPATGDGGPYPLVVVLHGYGGAKLGIDESRFGIPSARSLAQDGYAVLSYTARGFGDSCGSLDSRTLDPAGCADGWIHLADSRFEARDTQYLAGLLADQGLVAPKQIGVTGFSYGGGQAVQLGTLRDRIRKPGGGYAPWRSPDGLDMEIAASIPIIPWTDLIYSLAPNGRTVDYLLTDQDDDFSPVGVLKESFVAGLYGTGQTTGNGYYAPPGVDRDADLTNWFLRVNEGEPYGGPYVDSIVQELTSNHSAYYLNMDRAPAPTLISNGFTDDLFPVDEALRYANKVEGLYPNTPLSQLHYDYGHQRGSNKPADFAYAGGRIQDWLDRYVRGDEGVEPFQGVEALTQTCPASASSGGPFRAPTWRELHPGEVRFQDQAPQTIVSASDDPDSPQTDPIVAGNNPCKTTSAQDQPMGTATYRLPPVEDGYTLLGAPTVIADLDVTGPGAANTEIAARLWDVAPDGTTQTLVARALYRPNGDGRRVFQLHPNGYEFEPEHTVKLELLGSDAPYGRKSNFPFSIEVSKLDFRLPVADDPGAGQVREPAALFVPKGATLAPDYRNSEPPPPPPPPPPTPTAQCEGRKATIVGTHAGEEIVGTERRDVVVARGGNDVVRARGGKDLVCAGGGDDTVRGGAGDDRLLGATGADKLYGNAGDDTLKGGRGPDTLRGGRGSDRLRGGPGKDDVRGGRGRDDVRD